MGRIGAAAGVRSKAARRDKTVAPLDLLRYAGASPRPFIASASSRFCSCFPLANSNTSFSPSPVRPKNPSQRVPAGSGTGTSIRRGGCAGRCLAISAASFASTATKLVYWLIKR
jgi:hypothetical protein